MDHSPSPKIKMIKPNPHLGLVLDVEQLIRDLNAGRLPHDLGRLGAPGLPVARHGGEPAVPAVEVRRLREEAGQSGSRPGRRQ